MVEAVSTSETSVNFSQTPWRNIAGESSSYLLPENLKSPGAWFCRETYSTFKLNVSELQKVSSTNISSKSINPKFPH
jgi:hypothetical protein